VARARSEDVIILGQRRRERLEKIVAWATAPQHLVLRAKIVLAAWRREANAKIARDLGICVTPSASGGAGSAGRGCQGCSTGPVRVAGRSTGSRISC
jgi:hypothetical protein